VFDLLATAEELDKVDAILPEPLARRIESLLDSLTGEFIPEWDEVESYVSGERGMAGNVIGQARRKIEEARMRLLVALGDSFLARRQPAQAVRCFQQAQIRRRYMLDEGVRPYQGLSW
jgi:hypothetical protein